MMLDAGVNLPQHTIFFVLLLGVFGVLVLLTNHGAPLVCGSRALDPSQAHETVKQ